jgi:hypothetical protein
MKIRDIIQEFIPCDVCGNRDVNQFYFHVFVHKGSQPYVKCCECEEEYYSTRARKVLTMVEEAIKLRIRPHIDGNSEISPESIKILFNHHQ